jgi:hypothetical protein
MRACGIPVWPTRPTGWPATRAAPATTAGSRYERWQYVHTRPSVVRIVKPMPQFWSGAAHDFSTIPCESA